MNEGALTLTADQTILYANQCFARMVKHPLEQVTGSSFRRFLSDADGVTLRSQMKRAAQSGVKIHVMLHAGDGSLIPVLLSIRELANEGKVGIIGMVVTDMTEVLRNEEKLRALTHRVVQVQESERGRVSLELHDGITQLLCGILFHSQALATSLSERAGSAHRAAKKLCKLAGQTAQEVERISHDLRPSVLDQLGLVAAMRATSTEFAERTGVSVKLIGAALTARLPADTELTLYRILQQALRNVEKHARARRVTVCLKQTGTCMQLAIKDDGIGFDLDHHPARRNGKGGLGLLGMRERATYVGGTFQVKSAPRAGTEIEVRIPLGNGKHSQAA